MTNNDGSDKRPVGGELIIPVAGIAFTIYYVTTIINGPWEAKANAYMIGSLLVALSTIFILRTLLRLSRGEVTLGFERLIAPREFIGKRVGLILLTIGYIAVLPWSGFTLTTFVFLTLATLLLKNGRNMGFVISLSAVLALGGWLLFIVAFNTRFPKGPFETFMQQVF